MVDKTKKCSKCGEVKLASEFHKNKSRKDGLHHYCKVCANKKKRLFYSKAVKENPDYNKERYKLRLIKNPDYNQERYLRAITKNPELNIIQHLQRIAKDRDFCKDQYEKYRETSIRCSKAYKRGKSCKKNTLK
jgi:hypothetical protein